MLPKLTLTKTTMSTTKYTREFILQIPALRAQGKNNLEIMAILNIKRPTINYWIKRLKDSGHKMPQSIKPRTPKLDLTP